MDDYVMVPQEPTEEMVLNGVRAFQHAYSETDVLEDWKDCYRAMIAMAPIRTREWVGIWQPIETAPLDGTKIDLWDGHSKHRVTDAAWTYHYYRDGKTEGSKSWGRDSRDWPFCVKPTHWMPIPKPPEEKK